MAKSNAYCVVKLTVFTIALVILSGCTSSPSQRFLTKAEGFGFSENLVETPQFDIKFYTSPSFDSQKSKKLHLYIEGDGQPFFKGRYINIDPTSRKGLVLELMSLDKTASVLIGRPCYHYSEPARNCDNKWWTSHRYNEAVVSSMADVIKSISSEVSNELTLIGFSGGGALAMLIAAQLDNVGQIITINANLDTEAWIKQHNYTPLVGSLNPVKVLDSLQTIPQHHLIGANDSRVDSSDWLAKLKSYKNIQVSSFPDFDHQCCWADIWDIFINIE